jgi:hypothetical protein
MFFLVIAYSYFSHAYREAIVAAYPRTEHFKEDIIQNFYDGIKHKPETTFGNVKADVLADKDPKFRRMNFCSVIRASQWKG